MKTPRQLPCLLLAAAACLGALTSSVSAQDEFPSGDITYQGVLSDQGEPADGLYEMKFQFRQPGPPPILFDPPIVLPVLVSGGRFTVQLSTRGVPVQDPVRLELVICVRRVGQTAFVQLNPPQPITPAPRAIAADTANNVPASALPGNVALTDDPPIFSVPLSSPQIVLPRPDSTVAFGPNGECTIGVDPRFAGLTETDPTGFRLLGQGGQGCRLLFGPTDDCTVEVAPPGGGPGGLLLRDPRCIRVLPPDPTSQPGVFYFGPTDLCSLGIEPPGGLTGLVERDPVGLRLAGQDLIGCRLLFGPTDDCTVEIDPAGPAGLLLRDPRGIRILPRTATGRPSLIFGPTDDCSLAIDPTGELPGLIVSEKFGVRITNPTGGASNLIFGTGFGNNPDNLCAISVDPKGPPGLLLRDPRGIRILSPIRESPSRLLFGPTDDCSLGIDPGFPGLVERDPIGFRLLGQNEEGCRLIFGPTMDCTIEVQPPRAPGSLMGLILRDPKGIRLINPDPQAGATLRFGPTDDCSLGIDPAMPGLIERDPIGFRLLGRNNEGCRLIFGPTMDCTVEVDPSGPAGLLLRDPRGIRILSSNAAGGPGAPTLRFGPTDDCSLGIEPQMPGLSERDPIGFRLLGRNNQGCRLIFGPTMDCTVEISPPGAGPAGLLLRDPRGIRILNPVDQSAPQLLFGPTDDCSISLGKLRNGETGMRFSDPRGFLFEGDVTVNGIIVAEQIQPSSRRYKENIHQIANPIETLEKLQGVTFDWKEDRGGGSSIGFIAEEVGKVLPEVVAYEDDGVNAKGVNYGHLVAVTVEGIKAQQTEIKSLEQENNELKKTLTAMQAQLEALAAKVNALNPQ